MANDGREITPFLSFFLSLVFFFVKPAFRQDQSHTSAAERTPNECQSLVGYNAALEVPR